jgi:hypothetical protein
MADVTRLPDVPAPVPPGDGDAWCAPDTVAQYEITPGVVATVRRDGEQFRYEARESTLAATGRPHSSASASGSKTSNGAACSRDRARSNAPTRVLAEVRPTTGPIASVGGWRPAPPRLLRTP